MSKQERRVNLIGEVNDEMFSDFIEQVREYEAESNRPILITLSSDGGYADAALAICHFMRNSTCDFHVSVYGRAESAAVMILAYGDTRSMASTAWVMVHEDQLKASGSVTDREREARHSRRKEEQWNYLLAAQTVTTKETWAKLHKDTTYLSADECKVLGLVDEII